MGDFDGSRDTQAQNHSITISPAQGTLAYLAPEVLEMLRNEVEVEMNHSSDIYSLGICCQKMMLEGYEEFIEGCLKSNPEERMTIQQAILHPRLQSTFQRISFSSVHHPPY